MFITGPDVVKQVLNESVTFEELGGADVHASRSGVCHLVGEDETHALLMVRELLGFLPQNNMEDTPYLASSDDPLRADAALDSIVPVDANRPYDMKEIINRVVDDGLFFETQQDFAANIICGYARLGGFSVGIVANQPTVLAGVLDIRASREGGPLCAHLRCLQYPPRNLRRRSRLFARHRPGAQRHHHLRRQTALRLLRGDRAQAGPSPRARPMVAPISS